MVKEEMRKGVVNSILNTVKCVIRSILGIFKEVIRSKEVIKINVSIVKKRYKTIYTRIRSYKKQKYFSKIKDQKKSRHKHRNNKYSWQS